MSQPISTLNALSPLDGRYAGKLDASTTIATTTMATIAVVAASAIVYSVSVRYYGVTVAATAAVGAAVGLA